MSAPSDAPSEPRTVIVGAGVIGTACAYYLAKAGRRVTLIDQGDFGRGASHGNCGFVCPSHVLPFAGPGALWSSMRTLFERNSPLKIRPRWDPALWSWFAQFARRCNRADMLSAGKAIGALLDSSRTLYGELLDRERLDVEWEARGLLFVLRSGHAMDHYATTDRLLRDEFGLAATRYDGQALNDLEPALRPGLAGGWHYESDAHLRPDRLMTAWRSVLTSQGVEIHEQCPLDGIETQGRRASGLRTPTGTLAADAIVVATGAWTPLLKQQLRCAIPIQPGKGYSITFARPKQCPTRPMIFEEHRVAITPMRSGYRIGSTMEFSGYDSTLNRDRLKLLEEGARLYLQESPTGPAQEEWWGWRPMTPDSLPLIGPAPAFDNVYLAAGHNMLGLSMAPATGKLMAELILGQTPHLDPAPYAVDRRAKC